jgi:hypothetical protein
LRDMVRALKPKEFALFTKILVLAGERSLTIWRSSEP